MESVAVDHGSATAAILPQLGSGKEIKNPFMEWAETKTSSISKVEGKSGTCPLETNPETYADTSKSKIESCLDVYRLTHNSMQESAELTSRPTKSKNAENHTETEFFKQKRNEAKQNITARTDRQSSNIHLDSLSGNPTLETSVVSSEPYDSGLTVIAQNGSMHPPIADASNTFLDCSALDAYKSGCTASVGSECSAEDERRSDEWGSDAIKAPAGGCCKKRVKQTGGSADTGCCKGILASIGNGNSAAAARDSDITLLNGTREEEEEEEDKDHQSSSRYMNCRARADEAYIPTDSEHIANVLTHGLWIIPSAVGLWWMTRLATTITQQCIAVVYGLSLLLLFTISTTYHTLAYTERFRTLRNFFHIGDRAAIYLFIASSYTPWLMLKEFNQWGTLILFVVWTGAVLGIAYQYTFHEQYKLFETLLYLMIGVAPALIIVEMEESSGLCELSIGGVIYIVGLVFFKCDGVVPFAHAIWHVFVFIGAVFHYVAVCRHLLGDPLPPLSAASFAHAGLASVTSNSTMMPCVLV